MNCSPIRGGDAVRAVMLFLHGAMVADGYDDCEGDILPASAPCGPENIPVDS